MARGGRALAARGRALLTGTELTGLASSLFFDGHLLAAAQIANAALSLLRRPDQLRPVTRSPRVPARAVEELLRWSPSTPQSPWPWTNSSSPGWPATPSAACPGYH